MENEAPARHDIFPCVCGRSTLYASAMKSRKRNTVSNLALMRADESRFQRQTTIRRSPLSVPFIFIFISQFEISIFYHSSHFAFLRCRRHSLSNKKHDFLYQRLGSCPPVCHPGLVRPGCQRPWNDDISQVSSCRHTVQLEIRCCLSRY